MGNEFNRSQSEFNMSFGFIQKINYLLWTCSQSATQLDAYSWFHSLRALSRTLITEFRQKEIEQYKSLITKVNPLLAKHVHDSKRGKIQIDAELYNLLEEYEILIMEVLKKSGLLLKIKESAEFALEG